MEDNRSEIEKIKSEFLKCKKDPEYFIKNYIKITHPVRGLVNFELYPFQSRILNDIQTHKDVILKKFRQAGATTLVAAYALWFCIFNARKTVAILSKDDGASTEVVDRMKDMYEELPSWLKPALGKNTQHMLKFENGSTIRSKASSKQAGRSISASLLILDEAAFIEHIDTIWAAAAPTLSTGGKTICLSTVNGIGNWYHKMWTQAEAGENGFYPIHINWKEHPEYNLVEGYEKMYIKDWEHTNRKKYDFKEWRQEYECSFEGTGDTFIDGELLISLKETCSDNYHIKYNNRMRIWKDPEPLHEYILAADPSIGRRRDYSAFHIIDLYNGEQVAEFYSNRTPLREFAEIIVKEARIYNIAYVLPERNGIGNNLIYFLFNEFEYENLVMDDKRELGIQITQKNRDTILSEMDNAIRNAKVKINSSRLLNELLTFIIDPETGKIEADVNCHDDLIMSFALAVHKTKDLNLNPLIQKDEQLNKPFMPFEGYHSNTYKLDNTPDGLTKENMKWLLGR